MDLLSTVRKSGSRGGVNFSWDEVTTSVHRENYLGHSLKAPVGRWQAGRDLNWYAKADDSSAAPGETDQERLERERKEELRKIKEAEEDALARALGLPVAQRDTSGANAVAVGPSRNIGPSEPPADEDEPMKGGLQLTGSNKREKKERRRHGDDDDERRERRRRDPDRERRQHRHERTRRDDERRRSRSRGRDGGREYRRDGDDHGDSYRGEAYSRRHRRDRSRSLERDSRREQRRGRDREREREKGRDRSRSPDRESRREHRRRDTSRDDYRPRSWENRHRPDTRHR